MPRKDKNDSLVYRYLLTLEYEKTWDNYTTIPQINEVLSKASKRNTGNEGYPDALYVNSEKRLLILAEIKPSIAQFVSPIGKEDAEKYAVDGVKHYLSFFLKDALQKNSLKEFFEQWKIVGLAISGDPTDDYNHRIGTFLVNHDRIEDQKAVVDILCEADYIIFLYCEDYFLAKEISSIVDMSQLKEVAETTPVIVSSTPIDNALQISAQYSLANWKRIPNLLSEAYKIR